MDESAVGRLIHAKRVAIVGLSGEASKASYSVAAYLQSVGKEIVPVNPNLAEVLGQRAYGSLAEVPGKVDLVNVFRRPEVCAEIARQAVAMGARGLWLQLGITSLEARRIAAEAGMWYVEDRCLLIEHRRAATSQAVEAGGDGWADDPE